MVRTSSPQSSTTYLMIATSSHPKIPKKPKGESNSSHVLRSTTILIAVIDRLERVEIDVDRMGERLSLVEESCLVIKVVMERTNGRTTEMAKYGKVNVHRSLCYQCYNIV